ncbi:BACON domain-containing protein [Sphingobacterium cellulitidis]|uniref:BACON domain-containing protein n=1 Tax=Sphingobacterium cellulitidis TaxID=1768011 RepID=A0A8H9KXL3_9SPHI|nr:BACON domain-containing protein [Sphingobacterium soli]MBA8986018.1 hypothetical protein [Sphingobacterium soli]GGE35381.1 hypothetical protein GCM10011516_36190 [Sphingobacterium soli]
MNRQSLLLYILGILLLVTNSCKKDDIEKIITAKLEVKVLDKQNNPIEEAEVELVDLHQKKMTSYSGQAVFEKTKVGEVKVIVRKQHFLDQVQTLMLKKDQENQLNVVLEDGDPYLELEFLTLKLKGKNSESVIAVKSNAAWTVESDVEWLTVDKKSATGNTSVLAFATENLSDEEREGNLKFRISDSTILIKVTQQVNLRLVAHTGGNTPLSDSIFFTFNKPIKINTISNKYELCLPTDMGSNLSDGGKTIKFKYGCASLGRSFPIYYSVTDYDGNTLSETVQIDCFSKKASIGTEVGVHKIIMDRDNKSLWVLARGPQLEFASKLVKMDLESFKIVQEITLPEAPIDFVINPYNQLMYVTTDQKPEIYVYDPKNGKKIKTITLKVLKGDNEMYPFIYPEDILFTNSGFGMVNVGNIQASGEVWKAIDASKNDSIYKHPSVENEFYKSIKVPVLVNGGNDIVGYLDGTSPIILNGKTKTYSKFFESPVPFPFNPFFFSNPKGNKLLINGYWEDALLEFPSMKVINRSYNGVVPWAFSNEEGEENSIFALTVTRGDYLSLLNYSLTKTDLYFPNSITPDNGSYAVSKDNKYFIAAYYDAIYRFDKVMFSARYNYNIVSPTGRVNGQPAVRSFR